MVEEDKPTTKNAQNQYNAGILTGQIMIDFASVIVPYGIGGYVNEIRSSQEIVTVTGRATQDETTKVGRWMSEAEYETMGKTGVVPESFSGTTHVANPATPEAFGKQAKPGTIYVEFDVPTSSLKPTNEGWSKIVGPNSLEGKFAAKKGNPLPEMPPATNIRIKGRK